MPRSSEIAHYAHLLANLQVSAARTSDVPELSEIRQQLADAYVDIFTLLSHDALKGRVDLEEAKV